MSELLRENGQVVIAVLVCSILVSIALAVGPKLQESLMNMVTSVTVSTEEAG